MRLNIDSFVEHYPFECGVKGIDFRPLYVGSFIPRPYFTESRCPIVVSMTECSVKIQVNDPYSPIILHGELRSSNTVQFSLRTRLSEKSKQYTDFFAKYFIPGALGYLEANTCSSLHHWYTEWNSGTNYTSYVNAMDILRDPVAAIDATWTGQQAVANKYFQRELLSLPDAWKTGDKIQILFSK